MCEQVRYNQQRPLLSVICCFFYSWDEWVPESRVLKYVDSNLAKQKELQKANQ